MKDFQKSLSVSTVPHVCECMLNVYHVQNNRTG